MTRGEKRILVLFLFLFFQGVDTTGRAILENKKKKKSYF